MPTTAATTTATMKKRIVKKTATEETTTPAVSEPVAAAPVDAPTAPKKRGPKKAPTETVVEAVPEPVAAPIATEVPTGMEITTAAATAASFVKPTVVEDIHANLARLIKIRDEASASIACLKALIGKHNREVKDARKRKNKKKLSLTSEGGVEGVEDVAKRPVVFTTPRKVSDSLYTFLGIPNTTDIAPTEVITRIKMYIYDHQLTGAKKDQIHPDATLAKLFNVETTEVLSWPKIQRILYRDHYGFGERAAAAAAAAAAKTE
jgi:hypothetical protein